MASQRTEEAASSGLHHHHQHNLPYSMFQLNGLNNNPPPSFINQEGSSAFDFGELEEAIVLQGVQFRNDESKPPFTGVGGNRAAAAAATTLEMFPSWPMRFHQTPRAGGSSKSGEESSDSGSAVNTNTYFSGKQPESPISNKKPSSSSSDHHHHHYPHPVLQQQHQQLTMAKDISRTGPSGIQNKSQSPAKPPEDKRKASSSGKQLDAKTLRRLAQNREAARKSRIRKKAYVQQLETSRVKLSQLEQELQRARSQGLFLGGCGPTGANITSGAAIFDMEYARWLEEDNHHMSELRTGLQSHLPDGDLRIIVDGYVSHYDEIFRLKALAAKSDVFHLITGMWSSPAERCFHWMAGFRPSDLIKMLIMQLDPLTEQQLMGIYSLQHSSQQAEEALSQGLEQLQQSLVDTISGGGGPIIDGMQQLAIAVAKLSNLEGFVRQADNLRQQTLHQLRRILTVRQAARCFLVIGEYYARLRALSSLWTSRPRETMINEEASCQTTTDLQLVQSSRSQFSHF